MNTIWYMFPTADADAGRRCAKLWRDRGYRVACLTDGDVEPVIDVDLHIHIQRFKSWGAAQNTLAAAILERFPHASVLIAGSDDVEPDPIKTPEYGHCKMTDAFGESLYGVMQPSGDEYGAIHTCAPHPWIGIGYLRKHAPVFCEDYFHLYVDQEFRDLAEARCAFIECSAIHQYHRHWGREGGVENLTEERRQSIKDNLRHDRELYHSRKNAFSGDPRRAPDPVRGDRFASFAGASYDGFGVSGYFAYCRTHDLQSNLVQLAASDARCLIFHNSDRSTTNETLRMMPPNIKAVCAVNCSADNAFPLPLGLLNSGDLVREMESVSGQNRDTLLYLNAPWDCPNHQKRTERKPLYDMFGGQEWCRSANHDGQRGLPFVDYFRDLAKSRYCLSPMGAGIDCHRTWEALYLGCIPIVRRHPELTAFSVDDPDDRVFSAGDGLPIMIVDDWQQITEDRLRAEWPRYHKILVENRAYLTFEYWKTRIKSWSK